MIPDVIVLFRLFSDIEVAILVPAVVSIAGSSPGGGFVDNKLKVFAVGDISSNAEMRWRY